MRIYFGKVLLIYTVILAYEAYVKPKCEFGNLTWFNDATLIDDYLEGGFSLFVSEYTNYQNFFLKKQ